MYELKNKNIVSMLIKTNIKIFDLLMHYFYLIFKC
jgi:hypothetical protein